SGLLGEIEDELFAGNFLSDSLVKRRMEAAPAVVRSNLQAMIDSAAGFIDPDVLHRGTLRAMKATARVLINGQFQGSGVLVGPQLVWRAWHVVKPLFEVPLGGSGWRLCKPARGILTVEFDNVVRSNGQGVMQMPAPQVVKTHAEWLVAFANC